MLRLAILCLIIAIIAALLGFGVISGVSFESGKYVFVIFIVLAVLAFLGGAFRGPAVYRAARPRR